MSDRIHGQLNTGKTITCLGIMVADLIGGPLEDLPTPGGLTLVQNMGLHPGGGAVNTAIAISRLGLKVSIIGRVGQDALGNFLISSLRSNGVDTVGVQRDASLNTSATMVMLDPDGERRFVHYLGANAALTRDEIELEVLSHGGILHVAAAFVMPALDGKPLAELLQAAHSRGLITSLDTAWDYSGRWLDILAPALAHVDFFLPSLVEAKAMTGKDTPVEAAEVLLDYGVPNVIVKLGRGGCLVATSTGDFLQIPAYKVDAVDATGAGDAFDAGIIAGVYSGWSLEDSAQLANAMGALCVTAFGASAGLRSLNETKTFMSTTPRVEPEINALKSLKRSYEERT